MVVEPDLVFEGEAVVDLGVLAGVEPDLLFEGLTVVDLGVPLMVELLLGVVVVVVGLQIGRAHV